MPRRCGTPLRKKPQATIGEALDFGPEGEPGDETTAKKADIHEVLTCRGALAEAC